MPKNISLFKIKGQIDGLSFYPTVNGHIVRRAGGIEKNRIMNDPNFARTRENMNEFSTVAAANKLLRNSFGYVVEQYRDRKAQQRLTTLLYKILKLDMVSARGERSPVVSLNDDQAKVLLKGFNFNEKALLESVLREGYVLDKAENKLVLTGLVPGQQFKFPPAATDFKISLTESILDFTTQQYLTHQSNILTGKVTDASISGELSFSSTLDGEGVKFYLVAIEFLQEVNGILYPLNNGMYNVVTVIDVE